MEFLLHLDQHLVEVLQQYGPWFYLILFVVVFAETGFVVFPFLPGDTLLFMAGTLAAGDQIELPLAWASLWTAAFLGNNCNYWIGRWVGKKVFKWEDSRFFNRKTFDKTHAFYQKHGGKTIIAARFIPFARTFAPFVAGVATMDYRWFVLMDIIGASLWIFSLTLAGYWFGHIPLIQENMGLIGLLMFILSLVPIVVVLVRGRRLMGD